MRRLEANKISAEPKPEAAELRWYFTKRGGEQVTANLFGLLEQRIFRFLTDKRLPLGRVGLRHTNNYHVQVFYCDLNQQDKAEFAALMSFLGYEEVDAS